MQTADTLATLKAVVAEVGLELGGEISLPAWTAGLAPVPNALHPAVYGALRSALPEGLYNHQAKAITVYLEGRDVCLATPTASGKSIVFMAAAAHKARSTPGAKTLALYPAKALIQDQLGKWQSFLRPLGLSVAFIDGSVPTAARPALLDRNAVILMTPDVAHAWMMSHLNQASVRGFVSTLRLLVLDEAHVYDGVFGTNMAYFLRRLQVVSGLKRIIVSTATIGQPEAFLEKLVGRKFETLDAEDDGAGSPGRTILALRTSAKTAFEQYVKLIHRLVSLETGRFLAFADSRKMVEQIVASLRRIETPGPIEESFDESDDEEATVDPTPDGNALVLPYRAGYEEDDRLHIQRSLNRGALAGVVSTSALELGLDIGELNTVLLLGVPPSTNAFWQRVGRAGRRDHGYCLLLDDVGVVSADQTSLQEYVDRPRETGWLYLDNRYIQYANALCAAVEVSAFGAAIEKLSTFETLPAQFLRLLNNELDPTEGVPEDLYPLKQRGQGGPHWEFPIRTGVEKSLAVKQTSGPINMALGNVTFSQSLREAYPGAVYYYMARPYRVYRYKLREGEVFVKRCKAYTTQPLLQNMVFPKFPAGVLQLRTGPAGFFCESELQVSERINGFMEKRGSAKIQNLYGSDSLYAQRPLTRYFETTGVCWQFDDRTVLTESIATALLEMLCGRFGIQTRDLGVGIFHAQMGPAGGGVCQGMCIYDAANGSLRLTQQLFDNFSVIVDDAIRVGTVKGVPSIALMVGLETLHALIESTNETSLSTQSSSELESDWTTIVAPGSKAYRKGDSGEVDEVFIKGWRYTPKGLMYELDSPRPGVAWHVSGTTIVPFPSESKLIQVNLVTGEERAPGSETSARPIGQAEQW